MSTKIKYDSFGNSIDGTDYCTGVETFAQNLIEDNESDATMTFPSANGWISPRSETYKLEDVNAQIILPKNIYNQPNVKISVSYGNAKKDLIEFYDRAENRTYYLMYAIDKTGKEQNYIDISDFVVSDTIHGTLTMPKTSEQACAAIPNKGNTLIYRENKIQIYSKDYSIWTTTSENSRNWQIAIESAIRYKYQSFIVKDNRENISTIQNVDNLINIYFVSVLTNNPYDLQFRVEYIPMSSDIKIRARKSAKQNADYIQPINQRAEINSASALGKFLYNTAQKMGTEQITLVKWYTKIADIPPLGCRVRHNGEHYILTANSLEMTNCVQVKVTHTLSKNWLNKSQYVSVDQKYRNYKIPADILWRNMHWEDYIEVTTDGVVQNAEAGDLTMSVIEGSTTKRAIIPRIFLCDKTDDVTITSFFLYRANRESYDKGVTVPCTTMGIANSMVFSASMKDNLSAGLRVNADNSQYCEEVFYCYDNGKLDYARFVLSGGVNITDEGAYPQSALGENQPTDKVFDEIFYVSKDPGEALKFTYQCHWISDEADVVIGSKLAENHPLVKKWTENRKFRFWFLKKPLRQGEDKLLADETRNVLITTDEQRKGYFGMQDLISDTQKAFKLTLAQGGVSLLNGSDIKAWAITDENNNLYIGCNDKSKTTLYFTHIHERK